jgi:hypothetical protein
VDMASQRTLWPRSAPLPPGMGALGASFPVSRSAADGAFVAINRTCVFVFPFSFQEVPYREVKQLVDMASGRTASTWHGAVSVRPVLSLALYCWCLTLLCCVSSFCS